MTEELKPCPFCGGEGDSEPGGDLWSIRCDMCKADTYWFRSREEAVEAWNTRATPAPAQPEGEAWQPIETAPRDATEILTYTDERTIMVLYWRNPSGRWSDGVSDETWGPTHWMPLPAAPKERP